jgi:hypothetical protein
MNRKPGIIICLFAVLLASSAIGAGDAVVVTDFSKWPAPKGIPQGWKLNERSGKADFSVGADDGLMALHLKSEDSSFSLERSVNVDLKRYPLLSWKWKVTKLPVGGDFRRSSTDDQAAQLFVAFSRTKSIVYIWDTTAPAGLEKSESPIPFFTVKVIVLRSGAAETGKWLTETRNVYEDYKKLYGEAPEKADGVRIQINSQHTGTSAESYFADVAFRAQ